MTESGGVTLAEARAGTYRLLAQLALTELDAELAGLLEKMPLFGPALAESGGPNALAALRSDYTRAFLLNAHPYESVYLDETGMLNTSGTGTVLEHYREHGYDPKAARSTGAPDHLGLELGFMAHVLDREAAAHRLGNAPVVAGLRLDELHFLADHLVRWAPIFGRLLADVAESPFYRTFGRAVEAFVLGDYQSLTEDPTPASA